MDRRRWLKSAVLTVGMVGAGAAAGATPSVDATIQVEHPGKAEVDYGPALARLAVCARTHIETIGLPGMTLAVADRDGFRATICLGYADVDRRIAVEPAHVFQIGSISKSFVALAILKTAELGGLDLDAPVAELMPEVPLPASPRFTVRHLLNHSSGLPDGAPIFPRGGDGRLWCGFPPGSQLSYSNTGYDLLGLLLERVHGKPLAEVLTSAVLRPLGMGATLPVIRDGDRALYAKGYSGLYRDRPYLTRDPMSEAPWTPVGWGAGSVASTPGDMARYIAFLIEAGQGRGAPVLSDKGARAFTTPTIDAQIFGPGARYAAGIGVVQLDGRPCLHHTGGMIAFSSSIHVDAPGGVGVFASTNARAQDDYRPRLVSSYGVSLMMAARAGRPLPAPVDLPMAPPIDAKEAMPGPLVSASGETLALRVGEGVLSLLWNGRAVEIERAAPDVILIRHPRFAVLPLKLNRQNGAIVSAWWGPTLFAADPAQRTPPPVPTALQALAGRYDNNDPWVGMMRVVARADGLSLDGVTPLVLLPDGSWRIGSDPTSPERLRFDSGLNGKAQRLNFSGNDLLRTGEATDS
jgi:CubicO group peptidase (beta-lactamase class C family)